MLRNRFDMRLDPVDLRLERGNPFVEFMNGKWIEILTCKLGQGVAGLAWEELLDIHDTKR